MFVSYIQLDYINYAFVNTWVRTFLDRTQSFASSSLHLYSNTIYWSPCAYEGWSYWSSCLSALNSSLLWKLFLKTVSVSKNWLTLPALIHCCFFFPSYFLFKWIKKLESILTCKDVEYFSWISCCLCCYRESIKTRWMWSCKTCKISTINSTSKLCCWSKLIDIHSLHIELLKSIQNLVSWKIFILNR